MFVIVVIFFLHLCFTR